MAALTPKQLQAAALLASGVTITETAEKTATTRQTLHQWLKTDDAFIAHLNGLKHEIIDSGRAAIQTAAALAISTITALMTDSAKDEVRLAAAKEILMMAGLKKASTIGSDSADKLKKARIKNAAFDAIFDWLNVFSSHGNCGMYHASRTHNTAASMGAAAMPDSEKVRLITTATVTAKIFDRLHWRFFMPEISAGVAGGLYCPNINDLH